MINKKWPAKECESRSSLTTGSLLIAVLLPLLFLCRCDTADRGNGDPLTLAPGYNQCRIEFDGEDRDFIVQIPPGQAEGIGFPLVFFFHGLGGSMEFGRSVMGPIAFRENFVGIYPQGLENSWNTGMGEVPSVADDVGFTQELIRWVSERISIDPRRIYSLGYSNGGAFSYTLALQTTRFAAVASLSASLWEGSVIQNTVPRISVLQIHGELDEMVPFSGGASSVLSISFESALNSVRLWAAHAGLNPQPEISMMEPDMVVYRFFDHDSPCDVLLYQLNNTTHDIGTHPYVADNSCYDDIWEFFLQHPRQIQTDQY